MKPINNYYSILSKIALIKKEEEEEDEGFLTYPIPLKVPNLVFIKLND